MSVLCAYALPHPPLAVPEIGRGRENDIQKTLSAFKETAGGIAELAPETIIFITPHNVIYSDYFHISPGNSGKGDFSGFGAREVRFEMQYDVDLAEEITSLAEKSNIPAGFLGEKDAGLDHGVMVPMWFINQRFKDYRMIRISQSGMDPAEHYRLGQCIKEAADKTGRKCVLIASGDLSHKLSESGPYGFAPEGAEFDKEIIEIFSSGDFLKLFNINENMRERAAECGYNSYMVLAGCFDRCGVDSKLFSYEGPFGVGYAAASFIKSEPDENRDFLDQYIKIIIEKTQEQKISEDCYRSLARQSLEFAVQNGQRLIMPDGLPEELLKNRAGVFVSLHKNGRLRGCIGTIAPTTDNIALEIIQNAVSAGLSDSRFSPVTRAELPFLTYKVDVLSKPEPISSQDELDVKRYGVIVSNGNRRGLLLPNLDGIDTVDEQVAIARKKGGISDNAPVKLERFEVIRHE